MRDRAKSALRALGLAKPIKATAKAFGYALLPRGQHAPSNFMGLEALNIRTILDIGAYDGSYAESRLLPQFPKATIHSFEPSPGAFAGLAARPSVLSGRLVPHHFGLGETTGTLAFQSAVDFPASSSLLRSTRESHEHFPKISSTAETQVEVKRLDDVAPTLTPQLRDEILIKMDVQGYEDRVIRGGIQTLRRARACILEVQRAKIYDGAPSFREIFQLMDGLGFAFEGLLEQVHGADGRVLFFDAVFVRP